MTRFGIRITVWSSLPKPVQISGSSYGLVFESPGYRVHNEHKFKSPVTGLALTKQVRNRYNTQPIT